MNRVAALFSREIRGGKKSIYGGIAQVVSATDFDSVNGCSNQSASATGFSPDLIHVDGSWSTSLRRKLQPTSAVILLTVANG